MARKAKRKMAKPASKRRVVRVRVRPARRVVRRAVPRKAVRRPAPKRRAPVRRVARPARRVVRRVAPRKAVRRPAPKRRAPVRRVVRAVTKRRASVLRRVDRPVKRVFKNRFAKFYWLHRDAFNARRKRLYVARKHSRECVKCGNNRVGKSIFCATHLRLSRVYNRRSRARR